MGRKWETCRVNYEVTEDDIKKGLSFADELGPHSIAARRAMLEDFEVTDKFNRRLRSYIIDINEHRGTAYLIDRLGNVLAKADLTVRVMNWLGNYHLCNTVKPGKFYLEWMW